MSASHNLERSGILSNVSFDPNGKRDEGRAVEWLGPEAVALAGFLAVKEEQKVARHVQNRAARNAEIAAMRPGSAERVFARDADALTLAKERVERDAKSHRQPSERNRALVNKLTIETDLLRPYLSAWDAEAGYVATDPDAVDVAEAISASPLVTRWEEISAQEGAAALTSFSTAHYAVADPRSYQPVGVFLDASTDLCNRLYNEASDASV